MTFLDLPPLIEQQTIPENEEHPYVGDSIGGVEYVSGFLSKNSIHTMVAKMVAVLVHVHCDARESKYTKNSIHKCYN